MHYLRLIRAYNLIILYLCQVLVRIFLIGPHEDWIDHLQEKEFIIIAVATVMIAAGGYIINDYYDVKIDAINRPERIVIDRKVKRRYALLIQIILNFGAIGLGFLLSWRVALAFLLIITLLWFYSNQLKRLPLVGNMAIAFLTGMAIWIIAIYYRTQIEIIVLYGTFAFIISLIRELIKDIQDIKGDLKFGGKTLPILIGIRKTKYIIFILCIFMLATIAATLYHSHQNIMYFQMMFVFPLIVLLIMLLYRADTTRRFRMLSLYCKFIMLVGMSSMILYRV